MKNIHVLPTDKPSRLLIYSTLLNDFRLLNEPYDDWKHKRNIYITSDEEIKEGVNQWYLDKVLNEPYNSGGAQYSSKQNVIILTTDQDLIKDGVQAIDDEFLEWFVKNQSCESVKVVYEPKNFLDIRQGYEYVIIIPKEETSKEFIKDNFDLFINILSEPKQETIEEVAERYANELPEPYNYGINSDKKKAFIDGYNFAQQQNKNLYSEEDVNHLEWIYNRMINIHNENKNYDYIIRFKSIIEQFKKK